MPILPNMGPQGPDPKVLERLRHQFANLDDNGDWMLSFGEMSDLLRQGDPTMTDKELRQLYHGIDKDRNGRVDFDEFVAWLYGGNITALHGQDRGRFMVDKTNRDDNVRSNGMSGPCCDWCRKSLSHKVTNSKYQTRPNGTRVKTTTQEYSTDDTVTLRLPGLKETATLHTQCQDKFIEANAIRCDECKKAICDKLVIMSDDTGKRQYLHARCQAALDNIEHNQTRSPGGGAKTRQSGGGSRSPQNGGGGRSSPKNDCSECIQCGRPFNARNGTKSTRLQLPGLSEEVTLHSDGSCIDDYIEENALRCDQCDEPIQDFLKTIVLPWAKREATLHQKCAYPYAEENATRCSHCNQPIRESGVKVRSGGRTAFLHAHCESKY